MDRKKRESIISELSDLAAKAEGIEKEIGYLLSRHDLYKDEIITQYSIWSNAGKLYASLQGASDALKSEGADYVKGCMTDWYHFHVESDVETSANPEFESVIYEGNNEWKVIMTTPTDGRQRAIIHSDGASWGQVYSVDPAY